MLKRFAVLLNQTQVLNMKPFTIGSLQTLNTFYVKLGLIILVVLFILPVLILAR